MKKQLYSLYAGLCYFIFLGVFLYLIGFVENIFVLPSLDETGVPGSLPVWQATLVNVSLIIFFGLQHSVMARQSFKEKWKKIVPPPIERSTYVLFAGSALVLLFLFWQPLPYVLWDISKTTLGYIIMSVSFMGWGIVLLSTFLINHFHLFGLYQVWIYINDRRQQQDTFRTPLLYKLVRHPLYLGFLIAFWFAPVMTAGHFLFAAGMTVYIFTGIHYEEKDLVSTHGEQYRKYKKRVPKILPISAGNADV